MAHFVHNVRRGPETWQVDNAARYLQVYLAIYTRWHGASGYS